MLGEDALPGVNELVVSTAIYAAQSYCTGSPHDALTGALQLLDDAFFRADRIAEEIGENLMSADARARGERFEQLELNCLDHALSLLEQEGFAPGILPRLRRLFAIEGDEHHKD
jgi:hypothetical protein